MKKRMGCWLNLILSILIVLSISGCNNKYLPSMSRPNSSEIPTTESAPSAFPSSISIGSTPTIFPQNSEFKAWLMWKANYIEGIAWSPDSQRIATVAGNTLNDRRIHIIDLTALHGSRFSKDASGPVIAYSPDGKELVVGSLGLEVWDISSKSLKGSTQTAYNSFVAYFPNKSDSFLVGLAYPDNSEIAIVNLQSIDSSWEFQPYLKVKGYLRDISLNNDGSLLATATKYFDNSADDGEHILVWDLANKKQICSLHGLNIAFGTLDTLGIAASDGISLWNAKTCQLVKNILPSPGYPERYPYNITFSPDGKLLALALDSNAVQILDVSSGETVQELNVIFDYVNYIRFSPDGRFFATIARNEALPEIENVLIVWKVADYSLTPYEISPEFFKPVN